MIEIRIVDNGLGCYPEFQYRYKHPESVGEFNGPEGLWIEYKWSDWITAERVKAEDIEND